MNAPLLAGALHWEPSMYLRMGTSFYSSSERTMGGTGAAVGLSLVRGAVLAQADVTILVGAGTVVEGCAGPGIARPGTWSPAVRASGCIMVGDRVSFPDADDLLPLQGPAVTLGTDLEPLRYTRDGTTLSALAPGIGLGTDLPGLGVELRLAFFTLSTRL
jgi:hypothetical protein